MYQMWEDAYKKCSNLENQVNTMIYYHENHKQTFFQNYNKISKLKEIRFSLRNITSLLEDEVAFSKENITKTEKLNFED